MTKEIKLNILYAKVKEERRNVHNKLVKEHKTLFRLMDIMVACMILFNFSALFITNMTVLKENAHNVELGLEEPVELMEANPIMAEVGNFEEHPESKKIYFEFIYAAVLWLLMILCYIYYRMHVYSRAMLAVMFAFVLANFMILGNDFFNDLGFLLGMRLFF